MRYYNMEENVEEEQMKRYCTDILDLDGSDDLDYDYIAYLNGQEAYRSGYPVEVCPYNSEHYRKQWLRGYKVGKKKAEIGART